MKLNRNLAVITIVLLAASIWIYQAGSARVDRFERGRPFLPGLNPDDVAEIEHLHETLSVKVGGLPSRRLSAKEVLERELGGQDDQ